jgi:hypothetical protein
LSPSSEGEPGSLDSSTSEKGILFCGARATTTVNTQFGQLIVNVQFGQLMHKTTTEQYSTMAVLNSVFI